MQNVAYDWHSIIQTVAVRQHPLYGQLEAGDFNAIVSYFSGGKTPYTSLADYLLFGAAAILGRHGHAAQAALKYHGRLNAKTKAASLFFWAEEASAHLQYQTAEGLIKPLLQNHSADPELNFVAASCCFNSHALPKGRTYLEEGLKAAPQHVGLTSLLCRYQLNEGNMQASEKTARHLLALDPLNPAAFNILSKTVPEGIEHRLVERFEHCALEGGLGPINSAGLLFDIGRVRDAQADFARAFRAVEQANRLMRSVPQVAGVTFDEKTEIEAFTNRRNLLSVLQPLDYSGGITPIFIIGLPRTGSTLLDQALAAHPGVASMGENDSIPTLAHEAEVLLVQGKVAEAQARMPEWRRRFVKRALAQNLNSQLPGTAKSGTEFVVDKTLGNSRYMGFVRALFPSARFLHCRRNIMDVGLSIYFSPLHRTNVYATGLNSIADYIAADTQIIKSWSDSDMTLYPVAYEDMVDDMEGTLRGVFNHVGLSWDPDCLTAHRKKRAVHTYSAHQVRKALYKSSKGRWQNYVRQLAPFQAALESKGLAVDQITVPSGRDQHKRAGNFLPDHPDNRPDTPSTNHPS